MDYNRRRNIMYTNINIQPLRTWDKIPTSWNARPTTINYHKLPESEHVADGWRTVIVPPITDTQRLGGLIIQGDTVTYRVVDIPQKELQQRVLSQAESIREEKLQATIKQQVEEQFQAIADDTEALENQEAFPLWSSFEDGHTFPISFKVQHLEGLEMKLYRVLQSHAKQANWFPENVPALFVKILPEGAPLIWEVGIFVTVGEEYLYEPNGNTYIVLQSHTTQAGWTPPAVPSLWQLKVV
jgi:hypothetical protein